MIRAGTFSFNSRLFNADGFPWFRSFFDRPFYSFVAHLAELSVRITKNVTCFQQGEPRYFGDKKMRKSGLLVGVLAVAALLNIGCRSSANQAGAATASSATTASSAATATKPAAASAKVVNTICPIEGGAVDPNKVPDSLTREFKGQKVGFCCAGCPAKWDALSDAEKEAKLKAVMNQK
jgi:hypothetical protein